MVYWQSAFYLSGLLFEFQSLLVNDVLGMF